MATLQKSSKTMAISNELSSDVAVAILAQNKSPQELEQLKDIILQVHSALQKMSEETRSDRLKRMPQKAPKAQN
jgi:predicted transcriptional regulator